MTEVIYPDKIRYKRHCMNCKWKDDVERKWEEKPLDWKDDTIYECPECGYKSLGINITHDGYLWMYYSYTGIATLPLGMFIRKEE